MISYSRSQLGWSDFFQNQVDQTFSDTSLPACHRIVEIQRDRMTAISSNGYSTLRSPKIIASELAVGDWVLTDPQNRIETVLERKSLLQRRGAGTDAHVQLLAANVDHLFIVSSCNDDFNTARLERFLALAHESGVKPILLLTKKDLCDDPKSFRDSAAKLDPDLVVATIDAHAKEALEILSSWCPAPLTAAFVGSSGVGKTTLTNLITGSNAATGAIREDDSRGRHVTTARTMRPMTNGGWIIDMPGIRALRLFDADHGIDTVFDDLTQIASQCRFSDCSHQSEPDCAIQKALADRQIDPERLDRWTKLRQGNVKNTKRIAGRKSQRDAARLRKNSGKRSNSTE